MKSEVPQVLREWEAAKVLGVSVAALRRWRAERLGPAFVRMERCIGYRVSDIEDFLGERRETVRHLVQVPISSAAIAKSPRDRMISPEIANKGLYEATKREGLQSCSSGASLSRTCKTSGLMRGVVEGLTAIELGLLSPQCSTALVLSGPRRDCTTHRGMAYELL